MSEDRQNIETAAADWFAKLSSDQASEADWSGFQAWLEASPDHQIAFDRVERLWLALDDAAPSDPSSVVVPLSAPVAKPFHWAPLALAASLVVALAAGWLMLRPDGGRSFSTGSGQPMAVALSTNDSAVLSPSSKLTVKHAPGREEALLSQGAARFAIAHDPKRLFVVQSGRFTVTDLGTVFDVATLADGVRVAVQSGEVSVSAPGASLAQLNAGDTYTAQGRAPPQIIKAAVAPPTAAGSLVLRDQLLAEIGAELSRRFDRPIAVDSDASRLRFSGVLVLDDEGAVIRRLETFLPVKAEFRAQSIVIHRRSGAH